MFSFYLESQRHKNSLMLLTTSQIIITDSAVPLTSTELFFFFFLSSHCLRFTARLYCFGSVSLLSLFSLQSTAGSSDTSTVCDLLSTTSERLTARRARYLSQELVETKSELKKKHVAGHMFSMSAAVSSHILRVDFIR